MIFANLLVGNKPTGSPFDRPDLIYGTIGLAAALLVGAVVVYLVDRWRKQASLRDRGDTATELTSYRAMYERGEITESEYAHLRGKVAVRTKVAPAGVVPIPAAGAATPVAPPPRPEPVVGAPFPADYFDDPKLSDRPIGPPPSGNPPAPPDPPNEGQRTV